MAASKDPLADQVLQPHHLTSLLLNACIGLGALYFITFVIIVSNVMMNLFILVMIEQFEENFSNPDNLLDNFYYLTD